MDPVVESWRDILGPQALDLILLSAFLALSLVSFFRKSVRLKLVTFVAAVAISSRRVRLVSVVDLFAVAISASDLKYTLPSCWVFVLHDLPSCGAVHCGRICAFARSPS